ncbi:MAG: hypothetical protein QXP04_02015, partial [Candidatus Nanoarchaeia archaeon]|nr:hypothetical protein [Candidatus Jingweiarchaeum tengchongense]
MNKNKLLFVLVASLAIFSTVFAQLRPNVSFKKLHAIGQGLAINTQDPYDFHIFKIAVGEIRINNTEVRVGVAIHDKTVYLLKNIVVENGSFSATIMTTNMTEIGTINLT